LITHVQEMCWRCCFCFFCPVVTFCFLFTCFLIFRSRGKKGSALDLHAQEGGDPPLCPPLSSGIGGESGYAQDVGKRKVCYARVHKNSQVHLCVGAQCFHRPEKGGSCGTEKTSCSSVRSPLPPHVFSSWRCSSPCCPPPPPRTALLVFSTVGGAVLKGGGGCGGRWLLCRRGLLLALLHEFLAQAGLHG